MPALQGTWPRDFLSSLLHRIPSSSLDEQSPAKQHWHVAAGLQTTSSAETSPAVITAGEISMGRRATLRPAARPGALQRFARHQLPLCTHCLHQISPTPLPFPLSNAWSLFSTRLSKEEKKMQKCSKTLVYLQTSCSPFKTQTSRASSHNSQAAYQQRAPKEQRRTK